MARACIPEPCDDGALHEQLLRGDEAALADIYRRHVPVVFNVALRVTGCRSAAEDVTQSVLVDLWHRPHRFDPGRGSLRSWLATVAHHRSVDWVRQEAARTNREKRRVEAAVSHVVGVEETVAASFTAERVRFALNLLNEKERAVIDLAYFGDRTYRQAAKDLGLAEGTVKSRIRTGLRHLAAALHPDTVNPTC